jgi:hypothetical protein
MEEVVMEEFVVSFLDLDPVSRSRIFSRIARYLNRTNG